jgi:hypothetical protein
MAGIFYDEQLKLIKIQSDKDNTTDE